MLIGEVARRAGVSARMLRYYDAQGLVTPSGRTAGGYRDYRAEDVRRLFRVEALRSLGLELTRIREVLDDPDYGPASIIQQLIAATRDRLKREQELLNRLEGVQQGDPEDWEAVLRTLRLLRDLRSDEAAVRQRAALDSATLPLPAAAIAAALLDEADTNAAGSLRWALRRDPTEAALAALAAGLRSDDAAVRSRAVRGIADLDGDASAPLLRSALDDPDGVVRGHAALALGRRGAPDVAPQLVQMIVTGLHDIEAGDALMSLADADPRGVTAALAEALDRSTGDAPARRRLAQALVELPGAEAARMLAQLAEDPDRSVALPAAAFLAMRAR